MGPFSCPLPLRTAVSSVCKMTAEGRGDLERFRTLNPKPETGRFVVETCNLGFMLCFGSGVQDQLLWIQGFRHEEDWSRSQEAERES